MKVMVFGGMHMCGKSKRTGAAYDMARLYVASDCTDKAAEGYTRVGVGYEAAEVDCEASVILALKGVAFPAVLELVTDMRMMGGKLVPVVTALADSGKRAA